MKVALVHDWLTGMRGGEYVFEAIAGLFPKAEIFTLIHSPEKVSSRFSEHIVHTSWLQKIPGAERRYRHFLPLMPSMIETFDLSGFDLVISSSHCVAKGVRRPKGGIHLSYVHAPMRYIWDRYADYFGPGRASMPVRAAAALVRKPLQFWDRRVSGTGNVDTLVANSHFISGQIRNHYGREAEVIWPFADLPRFTQARKPGMDYLMVGAFAPYKRVDIAIEAFNRLKLPLVIVGSGQDERKLRERAGPTVRFSGTLSNAEIADHYSKCRALIFPGVEDFGITPLEVMAAGAPVVAYDAGGARETVTGKTGILFKEQTAAALAESVMRLERGEAVFEESDCRERAAVFSKDRFQREFMAAVEKTIRLKSS